MFFIRLLVSPWGTEFENIGFHQNWRGQFRLIDEKKNTKKQFVKDVVSEL